MNPKTIDFVFTDGTDHDVTLAENSDSQELTQNYIWSVQPILDSIVGTSPLYTIQVSTNDVDWVDYDTDSTDIDVVNSVDDDRMAFNYMRIVHTPNGVTSGDITYKLNLKQY